jgi:predicted neuraminidase
LDPTSVVPAIFSARIHPSDHPSAHSIIATTRRSTSSRVFPACKQTLTRSLPFGTVGHVIGRAFIPCA